MSLYVAFLKEEGTSWSTSVPWPISAASQVVHGPGRGYSYGAFHGCTKPSVPMAAQLREILEMVAQQVHDIP